MTESLYGINSLILYYARKGSSTQRPQQQLQTVLHFYADLVIHVNQSGKSDSKNLLLHNTILYFAHKQCIKTILINPDYMTF